MIVYNYIRLTTNLIVFVILSGNLLRIILTHNIKKYCFKNSKNRDKVVFREKYTNKTK